MADTLQLLACPSGESSKATLIERICVFVPIIGWLIGNEIASRRERRLCGEIGRQLQRPPEFPAKDWTSELPEIPLEIVRHYCERVRQVGDWPNSHFLPRDPVKLLVVDTELGEVPHVVFPSRGAEFIKHTDLARLYQSDLKSLFESLHSFETLQTALDRD